MASPVASDHDEAQSLLRDSGNVDGSLRLNFESFQVASEHKEKQPRAFHDCLGVKGPEDNVAEYYQQQVEMLEGFNEMDALAERGFIPGMSKEERDNLAKSETFAIRISNVANMALFAAKVYASYRSGSLAIIASTLDSLLDLLSGFILWFTAFSMQTPNPYQYPIGKRRMRPLGILVFASVMETLGLQIILESMRTLFSDEDEFNLTKDQERWVVGIMLGVTLVKLLLMLYCRTFSNEIVKAYAQDHFFDVITNIIGLVAVLLANYFDEWMDPVGAIIAMSYAKLAGLEPIYGLYSGFVPLFVYAIFGSSRQLAVGPVALVSLLVSNVLSGIVDSTDALYTELAILLALMVGIMECILGLLRLGWIIRFISHSVISGFTTASAIVIALSQAKYFLGYDVERSSKIVPLIVSIISGADAFSWPPFVMGSVILAILLTMKHLGKTRKYLRFLRAAGPLTAVLSGTIFVKIFNPSSISLVGDIPQGLPSFSIPKAFGYATSLIPTALLITGVAILESVGIAKALAAKNGYELDSNQELFGLGVANIFGSFFSAYPTTGSFSRSAVNHESGAKTGLSGIVMGFIMGCALLFMTELFESIPQCALAAIVISAVIGLVDYDEAIFLWRVDKKDFLLWTITSTTTLFLGIEIGVLVGVGFALAFVIYESANPHIAVLGSLPGTTVYRNTQQYPEAYTYNGIVIVRIDAPIYFANISYIKDRLREYEVEVDKYTSRGPEVQRIYFVIIEMAPVTYIDSSGVQALKELHQEYKLRDIQIAISNLNQETLMTLSRAGVVELIGKEWYFVRVHDAVQIAISNLNQETLMTLSRAGVVELIGKEWYFVRVHDAVQVCLQHVQSLKETPKIGNPLTEERQSSFQRYLRQRAEDSSLSELESGNQTSLVTKESDPQLEPLLSRKSS